jgi:hypothetical protein
LGGGFRKGGRREYIASTPFPPLPTQVVSAH